MNLMNTTAGTSNSQKLVSRRLVAVLLLVTLFCFAILPARNGLSQLVPAPDGDYGNGNTAEGSNALFNLSNGQNNTAIGAVALFHNNTGNGNTAIGSGALVDNTTGRYNTATGFQALFSNTTGEFNTATGGDALFSNVDGRANTATGFGALESNTSGSYNTATGINALLHNISGVDNTACGDFALNNNNSGNYNTALGDGALQNNTTADNNTASGAFALSSNNVGTGNTASGREALLNNTKGNSNVALGYLAGQNLTTGSNNIDIGANVLGNAGEANTIRIGKQGTQKSTFVAGIFGTPVTGSTVVVNSNGKLGVATSSARFKKQIRPMGKASETILALKPVSFRYKEEIDPDGRPQFGLIAEEVEKVNPDLVGHDENGKVNTVRYEAVNAMLLNEFLKEHRKVETQEAGLARQEAIIVRQQKEFHSTIAQQQKQIEALTERLQQLKDRLEVSQTAREFADNH